MCLELDTYNHELPLKILASDLSPRMEYRTQQWIWEGSSSVFNIQCVSITKVL